MPVKGEPGLALRELDIGPLEKPIVVATPPGDDRLFVIEQHRGRIIVVRDGARLKAPFLDLEGAVAQGFEQGLLGLAFHPEHRDNGLVYVSLTAPGTGDNILLSYRVHPKAPDIVDARTQQVVLTIQQPFRIHNSGSIAFGPDGYLYMAVGNGVGGNEAYSGQAQDMTRLLGKILRIDVDQGNRVQAYSIPQDNPFIDRDYIRPEIWASGLRNPWRLSIDGLTGDVYVPDVGSGNREELNIQPAGSSGGRNYGWPMFEGTRCRQADGCEETGLTMPAYEFTHEEGCAIIGGAVYRGCRLSAYQGEYFFGDHCNHLVRSIRWDGTGIVSEREWPSLRAEGAILSSIAPGPRGELHFADRAGGRVFVMVAP